MTHADHPRHSVSPRILPCRPHRRRWSWSGRATSACRWRCGRSRSGYRRGRLRPRRGPGQAAGRRRVLRRGRLRRGAAGGARHRALRGVDRRPRPAAASTSPSSPCRRRCASGAPDLSLHRGRGSDAGPLPAAGRDRRPRVDDLPRHDRGAGRADPRGGVRPRRRAGLPPRLQPRAHRPRQRDVDAS